MLTVLRGTTGTSLVAGLATLLQDPPSDPFAPEQVVVHSRGIERWLSQQLARRLGATDPDGVGDGISANIRFPSPAEVIDQVMVAAGVEGAGRRAWRPDSLAWSLLELCEDGLDDSLAPLQARVDHAGDRRLLTLAATAAHLHRTALHRPDMVLDWLDGHDGDGAGGLLAAEDRWQPALLRTLAGRIAQPTHPESVVRTAAALRDGCALPDGMSRVVLFGFTALPAAHLAVLSALASRIDVTLLLLHPSPAAWAAARGLRGSVDARGLPIMPARAAHGTAPAGSRLLHAWGRDVRELQVLVQTVLPDGAEVRSLDEEATDAEPTTVLGRLQAHVRRDADQVLPGEVVPDGSLTLHACHGRARQVQVLRDEILRAMAADTTLRPRDILVMCPDVEAFAPLVAAHLAGGGPDRPDLRVRIADRSLRQTNPMLRLLDDLLDLAATRVTAARLLDLVSSEPVRRRFGLSADDVDTLGRWVADVHIRWGVDADDRALFKLDGLRANTVAEGVDRLLLGVALDRTDHRVVGGIAPHDDMEGGSVRLAGRLAEAVSRLGTVLAELRRPRPVQRWPEVLGRAVDLLGLPPWDAPAARSEVTEVVRGLAAHPAGEGEGPVVGLAEVRDVLAERLLGAPSRANHMTGDLTVCTLVPMRSVPHRMVCLLGMDDDAFPRRPHPHVDDLVSRRPRVGDADPRTEDRQLLLDALMAAGERLVVLYTGADERSDQPVPPCVPVAELARTIDALEDTPAATPSPSARLTTTHTLYAHDPDAFLGDTPSFDALAHRAALADADDAPATRRHPIAAPLHLAPATEVALEDLHATMVDPAKQFVRRTLGVHVPDEPEVLAVDMPFDVDGLARWRVGEELISTGAAGDPEASARVVAWLRGRGELPPAPLGDAALVAVQSLAAGLAAVGAHHGLDPADRTRRRDMVATVGDRVLHGTVHGISGTCIGSLSFSRVTPKRLMNAWTSLLLATAAEPEQPWEAVLVGRASARGARAEVACLPALGASAEVRHRTATALLEDLLDLWEDARAEPLIAPAETAHAWAHCRAVQRRSPAAADVEAAGTWDPSRQGWGCGATMPHHLLLLGDQEPYERLTADPARPADTRPGHDPEPHRLGGLAMRIWAQPLTRRRDGA